jgi:hypothetical protein
MLAVVKLRQESCHVWCAASPVQQPIDKAWPVRGTFASLVKVLHTPRMCQIPCVHYSTKAINCIGFLELVSWVLLLLANCYIRVCWQPWVTDVVCQWAPLFVWFTSH